MSCWIITRLSCSLGVVMRPSLCSKRVGVGALYVSEEEGVGVRCSCCGTRGGEKGGNRAWCCIITRVGCCFVVVL